jgi:dTMP kinase
MFIVFEGIDGCGKSTQMLKLADYLFKKNKYTHIVLTREPYKKREIREILKSNNNPDSEKEKLTQLFIQDRREHINDVILPALQRNITVLSDRYKYSTICYQAAQGGNIVELIEKQKDMPIPDFVFIIDTPVEIAIDRMMNDLGKRDAVHKFEKSPEFLEKTRQNYLRLQYLPKEKIILVDGRKTINEIFDDIKRYFEEFQNL